MRHKRPTQGNFEEAISSTKASILDGNISAALAKLMRASSILNGDGSGISKQKREIGSMYVRIAGKQLSDGRNFEACSSLQSAARHLISVESGRLSREIYAIAARRYSLDAMSMSRYGYYDAAASLHRHAGMAFEHAGFDLCKKTELLMAAEAHIGHANSCRSAGHFGGAGRNFMDAGSLLLVNGNPKKAASAFASAGLSYLDEIYSLEINKYNPYLIASTFKLVGVCFEQAGRYDLATKGYSDAGLYYERAASRSALTDGRYGSQHAQDSARAFSEALRCGNIADRNPVSETEPLAILFNAEPPSSRKVGCHSRPLAMTETTHTL